MHKDKRSQIIASGLLSGLLCTACLFAVLHSANSNEQSDHSKVEQMSAEVIEQSQQRLSRAERLQIAHFSRARLRPNTYLSQPELDAIRSKIEQRAEPWFTAYQSLLASAELSLNLTPPSIKKRPINQHREGRLYQTQAPYCGWRAVDGRKPDCRDGHINPQADRHDYQQAIAISKAMTQLGLAYRLTKDARFARKATELIHHWALAPTTRMVPRFTPGSWIELSLTMPGIIYGADLIYDYPGWDYHQKQQFQVWVSRFGQSAMSWSRHNNFENWRVNLIATIGAYLRDEKLLAYAFGHYRWLIGEQINHKGQLVHELQRSKSLFYSLFALNAMTQTAEIARHFGVDLYDYQLEDGRGLKLALDYHAPIVRGSKGWPFEQIAPLKHTDNIALFELAYSHWQAPQYREVIEYWGRPMRESRVLEAITLTHGNRFHFDGPGKDAAQAI